MTLRELQDELVAVLEEAQALAEQIAEEDEPTPEAEEELSRAQAKAEELRGKIDKKEKAEARAAQIAAEHAALRQPGERRGAPMTPERGSGESRVEFAFGPTPNTFMRAMPGVPLPQVREQAYACGQFLRAVFAKDEARAAARKWCQEHRVMIGSTDNVGGYTVPTPLADSVITIVKDVGVLRRAINRVWPMTSDTLPVPKKGAGATVYYPAQGATITPSDITLAQVLLTAAKPAVLVALSRELMAEDSIIDMADFVAEDIGLAFATEEDETAFTRAANTGMGVDGILTQLADATGGAKLGLVTCLATHDTLAEVDMADVLKLVGTLPNWRGQEPAFFCNKTVYDQVLLRLKTAAGGYTDSANDPTFLGQPVHFVNSMLAGSAHSQIILGYGDLGMSVSMGDRRIIQVDSSQEFLFGSDSIAIRGTERVAINPHGAGTAAAVGTFVALKLSAAG